MAMTKIKRLDWDSSFFNLKIGRIDKLEINEEEFFQNLEDFTNSDFDLIYVFDGIDSVQPTLDGGSKYLMKEVDTKIVYQKDLQSLSVSSDLKDIKILSDVSQEDYESLKHLALESGHMSRYKTDKLFKEGEFERFYETWVDNSINKTIADDIFVYCSDNSIEGFVSIKYSGAICTIGLIAVSPKLRGQKIGEKLMEMCFRSGKEKGCSTLYVATQLQNEGACKFYEKFDMKISEQKRIYHLWKI